MQGLILSPAPAPLSPPPTECYNSVQGRLHNLFFCAQSRVLAVRVGRPLRGALAGRPPAVKGSAAAGSVLQHGLVLQPGAAEGHPARPRHLGHLQQVQVGVMVTPAWVLLSQTDMRPNYGWHEVCGVATPRRTHPLLHLPMQ